MNDGHRHFQDELDELKARLVHMAGLAEERVAKAVTALLDRDTDTAGQVVKGDSDIDALEMEIDERALQLLARQQPMARDLRFIAMAMKIGNDLERVGDHAVNIAENVHFIVAQPTFPPLPEIEEMVRLASKMLNDALDSFVGSDPTLARDVLLRDDRVDELHENVFRILLTYMMDDPRRINPALDMLLISRNLERIADLATNIAEDVVFMVEGRTIKHHAETRRTTHLEENGAGAGSGARGDDA
ncbi:MAG TPA: phosphate signaling complex protein PhoU [Longimicrobiales bacterium]|nr:phosphate signaling complex protein PhoU [Longimicrobiales bacterium]